MHEAVLSWVGQFRTTDDLAVLDIGGRDLNGNTRMLFPNATPYTVLDLRPGKGVDIIADAADWKPAIAYDLVLCTETFEHAERWREILLTAWTALRPGGWLVFTCAGPGRPPHSGVEAVWGLIGDEWYANVSPEEIRAELTDQGWVDIEARLLGTDTQGKAVKPATPLPVRL
jgi:SAM-dependent methyltransferase